MKWKRMMAVAAILMAAVVALAACGGPEATPPEETAEQQVLFDVTQFIGVDEAGLVGIMGEPDDLYVNDEDNTKEYTYNDVTYTYNGEQHTFYDIFFLLSEREDGKYKIDRLSLNSCAPAATASEHFKFKPGEDIFALFGIETDMQISAEQSSSYSEKYDAVMPGIDYIIFWDFEKVEWTISGVSFYYVK
jgi:hypothetical protein